jgi:hypothetical protein
MRDSSTSARTVLPVSAARMRSIFSVSIGTIIIKPAPAPLPRLVRATAPTLVVCARVTCFAPRNFAFALVNLFPCCVLSAL